jgi:hypothetical protein
MKIRKRYLLLGIILCMMLGPASVAAIVALVKFTSVPDEGVAPDAPDPAA